MKIGIIGGSGLYELDDLRNVETKELATPFGRPSDAFICGVMGDNDVYFLPRHGRGHECKIADFGFAKFLGIY